MVFTLFKILNFKFTSDALGNLFSVTHYINQNEKEFTYFQNTKEQSIHYHFKSEKRDHNEEMLDHNKLTTEKQTLPLSVFDINEHFRSPTPLSFVFFPLAAQLSDSHSSIISTIFESPNQWMFHTAL